MSQWVENLPDECPPKEAVEVDNFDVYRILLNNPANETDFFSQRKLKPNAVFKNVTECIAKALSVYNDFSECNSITKLPAFKNKVCFIGKISLQKKDGLVLKTGVHKNHYSWWHTKSFSIKDVIITQ